MNVRKSSQKLYASSSAVIANFLHLHGNDRVQNIISRVAALSEPDVSQLYREVIRNFTPRHRDIEGVFAENFKTVALASKVGLRHFSVERKQLLGAVFTKEYSFQAAALFNPSIVPHPDQTGLAPNEQRFVMSLRATGESHISSLIFQTGIVDEKGEITVDKTSGYFATLKKDGNALYSKAFIEQRVQNPNALKASGEWNNFPDTFTASELSMLLFRESEGGISNLPAEELASILDTNYDLLSSSTTLDEIVIFPSATIECMGIEDARFVKFEQDGETVYYGTYTAYDGRSIRSQLIETKDFKSFKIRSLSGAAIADKGMALLPEKVAGKYIMISRQGGEKINIMASDDLYVWNDFQTLLEPFYTWEIVQLGNCGSPIKTKDGWLLLIHGVGPVRTYVISAILLDLHDPFRIKARLEVPLMQADAEERNGYVPNVVYTCGYLQHQGWLVIPYAVSDSATGFATIVIEELIKEMKFMQL